MTMFEKQKASAPSAHRPAERATAATPLDLDDPMDVQGCAGLGNAYLQSALGAGLGSGDRGGTSAPHGLHHLGQGLQGAAPAEGAGAGAAGAAPGGSYVVLPGDTLWGIAEQQLGDGSRWPEIRDANPGLVSPDGSLIHPGTVLQVPTPPRDLAPELPEPRAQGEALGGGTGHVGEEGGEGKDYLNPALDLLTCLSPSVEVSLGDLGKQVFLFPPFKVEMAMEGRLEVALEESCDITTLTDEGIRIVAQQEIDAFASGWSVDMPEGGLPSWSHHLVGPFSNFSVGMEPPMTIVVRSGGPPVSYETGLFTITGSVQLVTRISRLDFAFQEQLAMAQAAEDEGYSLWDALPFILIYTPVPGDEVVAAFLAALRRWILRPVPL